MATLHLHRDDLPDALEVLNALLDWDLLADGFLSTSERPWCTSPMGPSPTLRAARCPR
jgi:hypothetical protein